MSKSNGHALKIERGVEIPKGRKHGLTATMRKLRKGDSFLLGKFAGSSAYASARYAGIKIVVRMTDSGKRVWRVA